MVWCYICECILEKNFFFVSIVGWSLIIILVDVIILKRFILDVKFMILEGVFFIRILMLFDLKGYNEIIFIYLYVWFYVYL